jgi:lysophospholipase L1-like esterase
VTHSWKRWLVAAGSAALALFAGAVLWRACGAGSAASTVELVDSRHAVRALLEATAAGQTAPPGAGLVRKPIDEETARIFFPGIGKSALYDSRMIARHLPGRRERRKFPEHPRGGWNIRTNSLGLREDGEVSPGRPDARVLVVGDSHVDGLCDNADSFPNLLERALVEQHPGRTFDVLNGGTGGWTLYNYLGALEAFRDLALDAFVMVVYGGNDFQGGLGLHHYHRGEPGPGEPNSAMDAALAYQQMEEAGLPVTAQYLIQAAYFQDHPEEEATALFMTLAVSVEAERLCREAGIAFLCVYLPPWAQVDPEGYAPLLAEALARVPLSPAALDADERIADAWLAGLDAAGIARLDLRPPLREAARRGLYWRTDHHLSLIGQRTVAHALLPALEELLGLER